MSHTPEPWIRDEAWNVRQQSTQNIIAACNRVEDAKVIVTCVNGCAGLNPAAYRECVEALKRIADKVKPGFESDFAFSNQALAKALAHAQE